MHPCRCGGGHGGGEQRGAVRAVELPGSGRRRAELQRGRHGHHPAETWGLGLVVGLALRQGGLCSKQLLWGKMPISNWMCRTIPPLPPDCFPIMQNLCVLSPAAFPKGSTKVSLLSGLLLMGKGVQRTVSNTTLYSFTLLFDNNVFVWFLKKVLCHRIAWEIVLICQSRRVEGEVSVFIIRLTDNDTSLGEDIICRSFSAGYIYIYIYIFFLVKLHLCRELNLFCPFLMVYRKITQKVYITCCVPVRRWRWRLDG